MRQRYRFGWRCGLALYFSYAPNHGTPAEFTSFLHVFLLNFTKASKDEYAKSVRTHSFNKHLCFLVLSAMIWYIYLSIICLVTSANCPFIDFFRPANKFPFGQAAI